MDIQLNTFKLKWIRSLLAAACTTSPPHAMGRPLASVREGYMWPSRCRKTTATALELDSGALQAGLWSSQYGRQGSVLN